MTSDERESPKVLTVNELINRLEDLAANHGCGNLEVKVFLGGREVGASGVHRVDCGDGEFVSIQGGEW